MKKIVASMILTASCVVVMVLPGLATQSAGSSEIDKLKSEIAKLQAIAKDPTIPATVRAINEKMLQNRLARLTPLIETEISGLKKYLSEVPFLNADERKQVTDEIQALQNQLLPSAQPAQPTRSALAEPAAPKVADGDGGLTGSVDPPAVSLSAAPMAASIPMNPATGGNKSQPADTPSAVPFHVTGRIMGLSPEDETAPKGLPNIRVDVLGSSGGPSLGTSITNGDGTFDVPVVFPSSAGDNGYVLETNGKGYRWLKSAVLPTSSDCSPAESYKCVNVETIYLEEAKEGTGELSRAIIGFEQSGAASTNSVQDFFSDMYVSVPFPWISSKPDPSKFGPRVRTWGDIRIASAPQNETGSLGQFLGGFVQNFANQPVNSVARSFEFLAGGEVRLFDTKKLFPSFDGETKQRFTANLIFDGGAISSLQLTSQPDTVFQAPKSRGQRELLAQIAGHDVTKPFVAFVAADRNRFLREFYGGLRFKTYYFDSYGNPLNRFPAILDLEYGMNEAVTGGRLRGGVFRIEGFYPLPYKYASYVYLFATGLFRPTRANGNIPLQLASAPSTVNISDKDVALIPVGQIDRDYYRFGVGIDAIALFKFISNTSSQLKSTGSK